jgi:hypothetical protein
MISKSVDYVFYEVFTLDPSSKWVGAANFFVYDTLKILMLLVVMITFIAFCRTFITKNKIRKVLSEDKFMPYLSASFFGAVTPFCSCSSIPLFLSFLELNIPLGVAFSFLITSPLINQYLIVLMLGFFGIKITILYIISGMLIGIISGLVLGKMNLRHLIAEDLIIAEEDIEELRFDSFGGRLKHSFLDSMVIVKKLWLWVVVGVGLGALIHNFVAQETIEAVISKAGPFSVPLATILGVPMYASCIAIVPVAVVLFEKGVPLGTALAFMMATSALSLPEAILLKRAMKIKLIIAFFGITTLGIILLGYLFNLLERFI